MPFGVDGLVWNEKDAHQNCPAREQGNWGYYYDEQLLVATPDQISVEAVGNPSHPLESCRFITISGPVSEIHNNAGTYEVTWLTQNGEYIWERRNSPAGDPR